MPCCLVACFSSVELLFSHANLGGLGFVGYRVLVLLDVLLRAFNRVSSLLVGFGQRFDSRELRSFCHDELHVASSPSGKYNKPSYRLN